MKIKLVKKRKTVWKNGGENLLKNHKKLPRERGKGEFILQK